VALQLTERDALGSHARDELGISETVTAHPVQAALVSALPIAVGAVLPLIVALLSSGFSLFAHLANSTAV
jgi:VIT1/CCC1 family predicted Fe2+/Mn2+ transporter